MKTNFLIVALIAVSAILNSACGDSKTIKSAKIVTEADSVSYLLGHSWGSNLKEHFPDIDPAVVAKGIQEAYEGTENALFADPMAIDGFIRAYMNRAQEIVANENLQKGVAFLEENAKREGVQTTESGLQYEVLVQGDGEKPTESSVVRVHYHGTTIDGVVFDSSLEKDPIEFPLNGVIKGWTEGLQLMNVGSKYKLYVPAELAYGNRQASAEIAANSALIFEVELLGIVEQTAE